MLMGGNCSRRNFVGLASGLGTLLAALRQERAAAQAPERKITIGIAGCAHIHTPAFVRLLKDRKDVAVKWVWDHQAERAKKHADTLGAGLASSADQIWSDADVRGVVICSETDRHRELVLAAVKAAKHVFVEKPLGMTAAESREMAAAIEGAKVLFTTGYFMRTQPELLFLKEQIKAGVFGTVTRADAWNCHAGAIRGLFNTEWRWMADPKVAGAGGFGDLGTHSLDILMWLLGGIDSVAANIRPVINKYPDCDETGQALIKFKSGATGTLTAGWVDVANPVTLMIAGTGAHATIVNGQLLFKCDKVKGADGKTPWGQLPEKPALPMHQFIDAVAGSKDQPLVTPSEAAARVAVMETMYRAARERAWLNVA